MQTIVRIKFGSHLYGTSTPTSDTDFKSIFVPHGRDIVLQRIQPVIQRKRQKEHGERNRPDDVDEEAFALHRFLRLVAEGQTIALDMLFAPDWALVEAPAPLWGEIIAHRDRLLSRRIAAFVGYCRTQANKYGIKGSRMHATRAILGWFDAAIADKGSHTRLGHVAHGLQHFIGANNLDHTDIVFVHHKARDIDEPHLECCNRKAPFTATLGNARAIYARLLDEYGARSLMAEKNEGIDWKALSHAVRVGHEALELLSTGRITFPLPNATHVLAVKAGLLPYQAVAEEIEQLLEQVEAAQAISSLPDEPDAAFIEHVTFRAYSQAVRAAQ